LAEDAGRRRSDFIFTGLVEWQGAQWEKIFSPAAASLSAFAVSGTESVPVDASIIEQTATRILVTVRVSRLQIPEKDGVC